MFVAKRMATDVVTAKENMTIQEARSLMDERKIRHLPVVDPAGKLIGIVTDRDMRDAMPSRLLEPEDYEAQLRKVMSHPLSRIMTRDPLTIYAYYTVQDTLLVMQKRKVGALPVIDEAGYLKGILSTRDLLKAFVNVMNIDEPGSLLCVVVEEKRGEMKRVVDIITEERISLGSVLVARYWDESKRVLFPYLLTNNVAKVKQRLLDSGFELLDPMRWYLEQIPQVPSKK